MICFNEDLANYARSIIDTGSADDEIKAAWDIAQAENMLSAIYQYQRAHGQISLELYNNAIRLDNQLRQDYKEIDQLQECANQLSSLASNPNRTTNSSNDIAHRLRMDVRGIYVATLLKYKIIERIDDALQQVAELDEK